MKDNYDFSKGKRNPYAEKIKDGYTVTVHYDFSNAEKKEPDDTAVANESEAQKEAYP